MLESKTQIRTHVTGTHTVILISGWQDHEARVSIGNYLVGLRLSAMDYLLQIHADMLNDTVDGRLHMKRSVWEIVGETSAALDDVRKRDERNPWIAEGIWHLCMRLAPRIIDLHPTGSVVAIKPVHYSPKDHGLDGLVLYRTPSGRLGSTFIETKAYRKDPNKAIRDAVVYFQGIENGSYGSRVRHEIAQLRNGLPDELQAQVRTMFWEKERTYVANPHYDSSVPKRWDRRRARFSVDLPTVPVSAILVMPHIVQDFGVFFDEISDAMRTLVEEL